MKATFRNDATGVVKQVKVGFSWTVFFFGFFPPLLRGDLKWAAILFVVQMALAFFTQGVGSFVVSIIFSFLYNKMYVRELMSRGFTPLSEADVEILKSKDYLS